MQENYQMSVWYDKSTAAILLREENKKYCSYVVEKLLVCKKWFLEVALSELVNKNVL